MISIKIQRTKYKTRNMFSFHFSPYGNQAEKRHKILESYVQRTPPPEQIKNHWPTIIQSSSRSRCVCGQLTNVYCTTCQVFSCFTKSRNCFKKFHDGLQLEHFPQFIEKTNRSRCYSGCGNLTFVQCAECNIFLCFNQTRNCFADHHEQSS